MFVIALFLLCGSDNPPESRAIAFLEREVPLWPQQNHCFSCHNNGDAARALYRAQTMGFAVSADALKSTEQWLLQPAKWSEQPGEEEIRDDRLGALQFGSALLEAASLPSDARQNALAAAAELAVKHQAPDGSWPVDAANAAGSPTTYGPSLSTYVGRRLLLAVDSHKHSEPIARATKWLADHPTRSTPELAALLFAFADTPTLGPPSLRVEARTRLLQAQQQDGGWGPFPNSPPEPFDTSLALLALAKDPDREELASTIESGRRYLIGIQSPEGSWSETTRPPGGQSYAQRLSTTGWATMALLATRPAP